MHKTQSNAIQLHNRLAVTTPTLQAYLDCGRNSAVKVGTAAKAMIKVGKRVLWNVRKVQRYLDTVTGQIGGDGDEL